MKNLEIEIKIGFTALSIFNVYVPYLSRIIIP